MRGRKPQSDEVKRAKGNPGRRRIAPPSDAVSGLAPAAPSDLAAAARRIWDALAPELGRLKFLRETDRGAFARYCEHLATWWRMTKDLRKEGETYLSKSEHNPEGMLRVNPKFLIRERVEKRLEVLEERFGLSPASRQQILHRVALLPPMGPTGELFPATSGEDPTKSDAEAPAPAPPASPVGILRRSNVH